MNNYNMADISDIHLILFCAPIVILIGYLGKTAPDFVFVILFTMGICMLIYGVMRTMDVKKKANEALDNLNKAPISYDMMNQYADA